MPDPQIMCFSKSKPISGYTVCLWPQKYHNHSPLPVHSLIHRNRTHSQEILFLFLLSIFDSSLSSQLSCTKTGSHLYFSISWNPPHFLLLLSLPLSFQYFPTGLLPSIFLSFHSSHLLSFYTFVPSFPSPYNLTLWFSEVMEGSVSLGLCEAVSSWCNYDGWSNFQRRLSPRGLSPPCFLSALMTF